MTALSLEFKSEERKRRRRTVSENLGVFFLIDGFRKLHYSTANNNDDYRLRVDHNHDDNYNHNNYNNDDNNGIRSVHNDERRSRSFTIWLRQ
jgi:hypothetical protein